MNKRMNEHSLLCILLCLLRALGLAWKNTWRGSSCSGFQGPLGQCATGQAWADWTKAVIVRPRSGELGLAPD